MNAIKYILNGTECNPANRDELRFSATFTERQQSQLELTTDSLEFVMEDYTAIDNWLNTYGRNVGMPLTIEFESTNIDYLLNFSDTSFTKKDRSFIVPIIRYRGISDFLIKADGLSFGILDWNESDFRKLDYLIIEPDVASKFLILSVNGYSVVKLSIEAALKLQESLSDSLKASIPVGGSPPLPFWAGVIVFVIMTLARIAYFILIAIIGIKLAQQTFELIFPKIRQHKLATVKKLLTKGCERLGYTFESTLIDSLSEAAILPVPLREKDPSFFKEIFQPLSLAYTNGYPIIRDSVKTLGDLLREVEKMFNAQTKVLNGIVRLEQREYYKQNAVGEIPIAFNLQEELQNASVFNTAENYKRKIFTYPVDPMDLNTYDDSNGTIYEVSSEVITTPDETYNLIENFDSVNSVFARGTRKDELNFIEKVVKEFLQVVDTLFSTSFVSKINGRKGVLQVSNQYFTTTKIVYLDGTKLDANQNTYLGADNIINNFHSDLFIENNQKAIVEGMPYAATEQEIFNLLVNNFVFLSDGSTAEILNIDWSEKGNLATITYSVDQLGVNVKTIVING